MFSVIIPVYNSALTIVKVLDSVFNQTRLDLIDEIIIVNDGSTDESENIIKAYANNRLKPDIIIVNQSNKGVSAARNAGILHAKGEWIALLDSDDCWVPEKIERQYECLIKNKQILFLGGATEKVTKIGLKKIDKLINGTAKQICIKNFPQTSTVVFCKECIKKIGLFDERMRYGEDINYYQKFLIELDNYYYLPIKLVEFGISKQFYGDNGLSSNFYSMHLARCKNTKELYLANKIKLMFYIFMQALNWVKLCRRYLIRAIDRMRIRKL